MPSTPEYLPNRDNLTARTAERWKPPNFGPEKTPKDRLVGALRRFFDLQAGSMWRDLRVLLPQSAGVLVDVGCGAQPYRSLVPPAVRYIGLDSADAEKHFGYNVPDTIYFEGTVWPVEDAVADTVLCTETLEHILEPTVLLREAHRTLKSGGGRLILTVPFAARWHYIPYDYWRYTPSSLEHLLLQTGFSQIAVYSRGNHTTVACYKVMALAAPFLFPQDNSPVVKVLKRVVGVVLLPGYIIVAAIANLTMSARSADDCLGYTAVAIKT